MVVFRDKCRVHILVFGAHSNSSGFQI